MSSAKYQPFYPGLSVIVLSVIWVLKVIRIFQFLAYINCYTLQAVWPCCVYGLHHHSDHVPSFVWKPMISDLSSQSCAPIGYKACNAFTIQPPQGCFVNEFVKVIANLVAWCCVKHILCVEQSISDRSTSHPMPRWPWVWDTFYKEFVSTQSKSYTNLWCFYLENNDQIRPQFCSSAVVTKAKFWPVLIIRFITKTKRIFTIFLQ